LQKEQKGQSTPENLFWLLLAQADFRGEKDVSSEKRRNWLHPAPI